MKTSSQRTKFKKYLPIVIFGFIVIFVSINTFIKSRIENNAKYNFVITKIEVTPTSTLIFYDKNKQISFWNFIVSKNEKINIGDLIYKEKCSPFLYIMRKDKNNKYKVYKRENYTGLFSQEILCQD